MASHCSRRKWQYSQEERHYDPGKLRAGTNDPKGLLNLVGSSTNALERTKKIELLKTSGFLFNKQGPNSLGNKLEAVKLRLDLGLGGHTVEDTLLFGAKEMSSPGFLLPKNITERENNIVDCDSTYVHQNSGMFKSG